MYTSVFGCGVLYSNGSIFLWSLGVSYISIQCKKDSINNGNFCTAAIIVLSSLQIPPRKVIEKKYINNRIKYLLITFFLHKKSVINKSFTCFSSTQ